MAEPRTSKTIAERVEVDFPKRPNRLRRGKWRVAAAAAVAALGWIAWSAGRGDQTIYQAGPLSTAHGMFADDCARCHQANWTPLRRLAALDNSFTSTPNTACVACHPGPDHGAHPAAAMGDCADCHREHHGEQVLAWVEDEFCTACHDALPPAAEPPVSFALRVPNFADHPEFALLRAAPRPEDFGPAHAAVEVAELQQTDDGYRWIDRARLRFNHAKHLDPQGVLTPDFEGLTVDQRERKKLDCQSCHEPDAERMYFKPIRYEQHCRECHPLVYAEELALGAPLPHREPEIVRSVMRRRYGDLYVERSEDDAAEAAPATLADDDAERLADLLRTRPGRPAPRPLAQGELDWSNQMMARAEHVVLGAEAKGGCRFCHVVDQEGASWSVAPPSIPDRWQTHSRFSHDPHRMLQCAACHGEALASTMTTDILLPKIELCHTCHRTGGGARTDCVECHAYHQHGVKDFAGVLSIQLEQPATTPDSPQDSP